MIIEPEKCSGCRICEQICQLNKRRSINKSYRSGIKIIKRRMKNICIPIVCSQCEYPLCSKVCPLEALIKDPQGIIQIKHESCIGCKLCSYVCPLGAIMIDPETRIATKCNQCDGNPLCVKYCPSGAIRCVDFDKIDSELKRAKTKKLLELITSK